MQSILVIEDEQNIRLSISICLEQAGYKVMAARDGLEGIQTAIGARPDLILLDLILPKMNGYLICEALKSQEATRSIPILVMSAKAEEEDIHKAKMLGADGYIIKPFSPGELRNRIKVILNGGEES